MKPRVYSCVPTYGHFKTEAAHSHYCLQTQGGVEIIPAISTSSLLCHGFNRHWAAAINYAQAGIVDYFLMHHDDIDVHTPMFVDVMLQEMWDNNAAVLSVVQPIKDGKNKDTSTAVESCANHWSPRRLTFQEIYNLPVTFTMPGLLVNTGLLIVDLRRHEFQEEHNGELYFRFEINDRIVRGDDGMFVAQVRPEDWNFSRLCHSRKLPVYATRKIQCFHYGHCGFSNQPILKGQEPCLE